MAGGVRLLRLEADSLRGDVMRTHAAAAEAAQALEHAGAAALDAALVDAFGDDPPETLAERAGRLRAAGHYALAKAAELMGHAGRLEQLAAVGRAVDAGNGTE